MTELIPLGPRVSASPWALYNSESTASIRPPRSSPGFYQGMLQEDISHAHYAYEVRVNFQGIAAEVARDLLGELLADFDRGGFERDPKHLIFSLVDVVLEESMACDGVMVEAYTLSVEEVEAIASRRRRHRDAAEMCSLGYLPGWSLRRTRRGTSQISPTPETERVQLPASRLRLIAIHPALRRRWRRAVTDLADIDSRKLLGDVSSLQWVGYDFAQHVKAQELLLAECTADIGWDARGLFNKHVTTQYIVYRRLKFVAFWRAVVDDVVTALNELTSDPAVLGTSTFSVSLSGLPSVADLQAAMSELPLGSLPLAAINDGLLMPRYASRGSDD